MARYCTTCGRQLREGDSFCLGCGKPIAGTAAPSGESVGTPPQGSYPPQDANARPAIELDSESDMAATEVWQVPVSKTPNHADPFVVEVPKDELRPIAGTGFGGREEAPEGGKGDEGESSFGSVFGEARTTSSVLNPLTPIAEADDDDYDESPTIVAQPIVEDDEDDEDESPTIVVPRERYVLVREEDGQRTELTLPCILGRGKAADKRVKGNLAISRKHAKVFQEDELIMVQDLDSTNGTFVDGVELEGDQTVPVSDGTAIRLGTEDFTFRIESL